MRALALDKEGKLCWEKSKQKYNNVPVKMCLKCLAYAPEDQPRACQCLAHLVRFASKKEANRYIELRTLLAAKQISGLSRQPEFKLIVNGVQVAKYLADFQYKDKVTGSIIVEDAKSPATRTKVYRLKLRLLKALYNIDVNEV